MDDMSVTTVSGCRVFWLQLQFWTTAKLELQPEHLWCHLLTDCSIAHSPLPLYVSKWDVIDN